MASSTSESELKQYIYIINKIVGAYRNVKIEEGECFHTILILTLVLRIACDDAVLFPFACYFHLFAMMSNYVHLDDPVSPRN